MSTRDQQQAEKRQGKKPSPDLAVHAAHQQELEGLRKELERLEASNRKGKHCLQNAEIQGAVHAIYGAYGEGVLEDAFEVHKNTAAIAELRRKIATLEKSFECDDRTSRLNCASDPKGHRLLAGFPKLSYEGA